MAPPLFFTTLFRNSELLMETSTSLCVAIVPHLLLSLFTLSTILVFSIFKVDYF